MTILERLSLRARLLFLPGPPSFDTRVIGAVIAQDDLVGLTLTVVALAVTVVTLEAAIQKVSLNHC